MNGQHIDHAHQLIEALRDHPLWAQSGLIIAIIVGVMLWASGRRVLKPAFAVIGALLGGILGHAAVPSLGFEEPFGLRGDLVGAAGGGAIGALAAVLIFRLAIGVLTSGVMAGLGVLAAAVIIQMNPAPPASLQTADADPPGEVAAEPLMPPPDGTGATPGITGLGEFGFDEARDAAADPGSFARDLFIGLKADVWDPLSVRDRTLLAGAAFLGLLIGLGLSVFFPKRSTALVTAFAGAGLWLPGAYLLTQALDLPGKAMLERSAVQWTAIWFVVSLTGLLIQTVGLKERGSKPRRDDGEDWDDGRDRRRRRPRRSRDDDYDDEWD
ncbi:MAG: hypothetical protein AAGF47_11470 [Planctomycetota bacterium]